MRTRSPMKLLAGVAVVAVAAFAAAYFLFFTPDSPDPLRLSAGGGGEIEIEGIWSVAPGSEARYRVREKLAALPATRDAVGSTPAVSGQVRFERTSDGVAAHDAKFEADLTKLKSDEDRRDNLIRSRGLESERFPMATFVAAEPIRIGESAIETQPVKISAVGDLNIHGVTKRVTIPIDAQVVDGKIELVGSLKFSLGDFGISPPDVAGFVTVESDATLEFRLLLEQI